MGNDGRIRRSNSRILGFDLIRLFSFAAIHIYHVKQIGWGSLRFSVADKSLFFYFVEQYARALSFSGFTITFLTSFLLGRQKKSVGKYLFLYAFMLMGWVSFCLIYTSNIGFRLMWDIYPLLVCGLITATIARSINSKWIYCLGGLGFALLWTPVWELDWFDSVPLSWRAILVGVCEVHNADWPVFPWIGLIWLGYAFGTWVSSDWFRIERAELLVWTIFLGLSIPQLGEFHQIPIDQGYTCFVFRRTPGVFWSHFVWALFLMRLSIDPRAQSYLEKKSALARWVSDLHLSRRFWIYYLVDYLVCVLIYRGQVDFHTEHFWMAQVIYLGVPLGVEVICRKFLVFERGLK